VGLSAQKRKCGGQHLPRFIPGVGGDGWIRTTDLGLMNPLL
jgi:hypothetical protein